MVRTITSLHNPTVKNLVKLRQRRARDRQQLMLIDGARALRLALHNAFPVTTIYFAEDVAQPMPTSCNVPVLLGSHSRRSARQSFTKLAMATTPMVFWALPPSLGWSLTTLPSQGSTALRGY